MNSQEKRIVICKEALKDYDIAKTWAPHQFIPDGNSKLYIEPFKPSIWCISCGEVYEHPCHIHT